MSDEQDDEALAAEWAAALGEQEDGESGGDMGDMSAED